VAVSVSPDTFVMVLFDQPTILAVAERVAGEVGLPDDLPIQISVDEAVPLGRVNVRSTDPVVIEVDGGSFEDPRHPRQLSEDLVADTLGRLYYQVLDRRDPGFGAPPDDDDLPLAHKVAWDTYAVGRLQRLGYDGRRQVRLYAFRNRHGFTDAADEAFETLWSGEGLTWADITRLSDEAVALRPV
jgi:hypothetical protein